MPVNKNALRRYILIDRCIRNKMNSFPSRDKLQQKISDEMMLSEPISIETIDKDIKAMKDEYNAPIKYDRNRKGYYYADENYSFDHKISDEDLWVLDFAVAAVQVYGHSDINNKFVDLANRLNTGTNNGRELETVPYDCIQIESATLKMGYQWLFDLYLYTNQQQTVAIHYSPFNRESSKHTISPYLLKEYKNRWYLVGYSHEKKKTLVFALDRIQQMGKSRSVFINDPEFDKWSYFKYSFGVYHRWDSNAEKVRLLFSSALKPYILSMPLHHSQKVLKDDANGLLIEIEVFLKENNEFLGVLLSYGADVKVISPIDLRKSVIEIINKIKKSYSKV